MIDEKQDFLFDFSNQNIKFIHFDRSMNHHFDI